MILVTAIRIEGSVLDLHAQTTPDEKLRGCSLLGQV
jgi:hypothetical protein